MTNESEGTRVLTFEEWSKKTFGYEADRSSLCGQAWEARDAEIAELKRQVAEAGEPMACGHPNECLVTEHKWTGCKQGGSPVEEGSREWVRYCEVCGREDTCEDPLPPCYCTACEHERLAVTAALRQAAEKIDDIRSALDEKLEVRSVQRLHKAWVAVKALIPTVERSALDAYVQERVAEARLAEHNYLCIPCFNAVRAQSESQRCGRGLELAAQVKGRPHE